MLRHATVSTLTGSIALMSVAAVVHGDTLEYTDDISLMTTNWSGMMSFPQFDPALGTLNSVTVELGGHVEGDAKFESLDAEPATVVMNLAAEIELQRPDNSPLAVVVPLVETTDNVTAFDGTIDFLGDSGRTYEGLSGDDMETEMTTLPSDLALFTGTGNIDLPAVASGASTGSGAGNLILQFATSASSNAKVIYDFTPAPLGACCYEDGSCMVLTEAECGDSGGTYQGDDTGCDPNPCEAVGACCSDLGSCSIRTEQECLDAGSEYFGDNTDCDPDPCPKPGACCVGEECTIEVPADCDRLGGEFQGEETSCDPNPCLPAMGACCFADGSCQMLNENDCDNAMGTYQGDDTTCDPNPCPQPPAGACCFSDESCQVLTQVECEDAGGVYQGDDEPCDPNPCEIVPTVESTWGQIKNIYR